MRIQTRDFDSLSAALRAVRAWAGVSRADAGALCAFIQFAPTVNATLAPRKDWLARTQEDPALCLAIETEAPGEPLVVLFDEQAADSFPLSTLLEREGVR